MCTPKCNQIRQPKRLLRQEELDQALWLNEHVYTAYRPPHQPKINYIKSIFEWNNETINIWTHLIGFIYFTYQQYDINRTFLPLINASTMDHIVTSTAIFCIQLCMLFSTLYHTFGCSCMLSRQKWLRCDVFGITAGLIGMYTIGIYTAFYCFEEIRINYFTMLLGLFVISAYMPSRDDFLDSKLFGTRIGYLHITYITIAAFGLCPTAHWVSLYNGVENEYVMKWLPQLALLYGLTATAFAFYTTMVPERFKPGVFDIVGCSHQWWHLLILTAMLLWYWSGIEHLTYHKTNPTHCITTTQKFNQTFF